MKIRLVALLITVTNIAIAQNHDHHSGHGKQISNKTESKIKFTPTSDLKVRMEKILSLRSLDFLENQKNYFYMIITTILFLIVLGLKLSRNLKFWKKYYTYHLFYLG